MLRFWWLCRVGERSFVQNQKQFVCFGIFYSLNSVDLVKIILRILERRFELLTKVLTIHVVDR